MRRDDSTAQPKAGTLPTPVTTGSAASIDPHQWVDQHGDYLFRYALIRVRNETVAEDLVQETLLSAFKSTECYDGKTPERAWLTGILKHKVLDYFRRQTRERSTNDDQALPSELEGRFDDLGLWKRQSEMGPADWGEAAPALIEREEFMAALKVCLGKLPPRCANAFVLREMEAEPSERIQELLGISASNFWVLMHRARMQLRLCLEQNWLKT